MHNAPAVSYPMGRSRFHGFLVLLCAPVGALLLLAWSYQADDLQWLHALAAFIWLLTVVMAGWQWRRTPAGKLVWGDAAWCWVVAGQSHRVTPEVTLDLQHLMLLRLVGRADRSVWWLWPERRADPLHWQALRRALFSRSSPDSDADTQALVRDPDARDGVSA